MFSHFFIDRPIFAAVVSIVIVILGSVALVSLPVARYPEMAPPTVEVTASYPGASVETIAETVATPIEQEVNGVEGMIFMTSTSSPEGSMTLIVTFEPGTDLDMATVLVQNRVALAEPKLPEEVRRLGVNTKKKSSDILMLVTLSAPGESYDEVFLNNVAYLRIRDELTRVNGVSEVTVFGTEYAIRVWLDPDRLRARDLTTNDIVAAIREQNVEVAAGKIGEPPAPPGQAFELVVSTEGRLSEVEQFENLIVKASSDGRVTYLRDVADVELGAQSYNLVCRYNGETTSALVIYPIPGANWVGTADAIRAKLDELQPTLPQGVQHSVPFDATDVIRASIQEVVVTLFITLALVVFSVYVFLQDVRATLVPAVTIPVSLVGTFAVMAAMGYSLNILTLFGLVLVIGIVVDDAIVVVENTSRLLDEGKSRVEAAKQSMIEVSGPVVATTLVLLAVFLPTLFMGGIIGSLFGQFAMTISIATVFSSINALTLSPALCALLLRRRPEKPAVPFRMFNAALAWLTHVYAQTVRRVLRVAPVALVLFAGLIGLAGWGFSRIPSGFVPQEDEGWFLVSVQLPDAASQERTMAVTSQVNDILLETAGVKDVVMINGFSFIDSSRSANTAGAIVTLEPWDDRSTPDLFQDAIVRNVNMRCREIQEAMVFALTPPSLPGLGNASGITLQLQDRGGIGAQALANVAIDISGKGNEQSAITGMFTMFRASVPQLFLDIDREQIKTKAIPLQSVFDTLTAYLGSVYVNDFTRFGRIYQVRVQAQPSHRSDPKHIEGLQLRTPGGEMIPLGAVLSVKKIVGPQTITHFNIYPAARINAQAAPGFSTGQAMDIFEQMAAVSLPPSVGYAWTDISFQEKAAQGAAAVIFLFSILMVYLVLAAQYESWSIPLSVVLAVPTALLGAVAGVIIGGFDNNVYTQIGIVLLIGLSAKTAILIVEFAKVRRAEGASIRDAAVDAARLRFRAVLMTAASFILGVIPLLVATGAGAASRRVLGTVVFMGMLAATIIGVIAIPLLYFVIQWLAEVLRKPKAMR